MDVETARLLVCDGFPRGWWLPISGTLAPGLNPSLKFRPRWRATAHADHGWLRGTLHYDKISKYVGSGQMYKILSPIYPVGMMMVFDI